MDNLVENVPSKEEEPASDATAKRAAEMPKMSFKKPEDMFQDPSDMDRDHIINLLAQKTLNPKIVGGFLFVLETALLLCSGLFMIVFHKAADGFSLVTPLITFGATIGVYVILFHGLHLFSMHILRDIPQQFMRVIAAWTSCLGGLFLAAQLFPELDLLDTNWVSPFFISGIAIFAFIRLPVSQMVKKWTQAGLLERRAIIVGGGKDAEEVILNLERQPANDIRICGIFDDRTDERSPDTVAGYPKLGTVAELLEFARLTRLDMLIVSLPLTAGGRVREMLKRLWVLPVDIRLSAHSNKLAFKPRNYSYIGAMPFIKLMDRPIAGWGFVRKRIFDAVVSALLLVLLAPLMLLTALLIKLDSKGPVFFRQKRHGFNNEVIDVWKFRSMYSDQCDATAKVVVTRDDPRVTRIGNFIRKTSMDELPQLWNVLKGELSLVGPRPHAVHAHLANQPWNEVVDGYFARHRVKPGVTGWAQINGWRGEVDNVEKIKQRTDYDLYYIENWSLRFDLYILILTPFRLLNTKNAY